MSRQQLDRPAPASSPSGRRARRPHTSGSRAASPCARAAPRGASTSARVSFASPCSARSVDALNRRSRDRAVLQRRPAPAAGSCSAAARPTCRRACAPSPPRRPRRVAVARPARSASCSVTSAPALVAASSRLRELRAQRRLLLVERAELRLVGFRQLGAGVNEVAVVALDQIPASGVERRRAGRRAPSRARRASRPGRWRPGARRASARRPPPPSGASSFVFACVMAKNTLVARVEQRPLRSIATIVLSNVGASAWLAIFATSARCCSMPSSMAGW